MNQKDLFKIISFIIFSFNIIALPLKSVANEDQEDRNQQPSIFNSLEILPFEIQHKISTHFDNTQDLVAFGSTSSKNQKIAEYFFKEKDRFKSQITGSLPKGREWKISYFVRHLMPHVISSQTIFSSKNENFYLNFANACQNFKLPLEYFVRYKLWIHNLKYMSYDDDSKFQSYGFLSSALTSITNCFYQLNLEIKDLLNCPNVMENFYKEMTEGLNNQDIFFHEIALELLTDNLYSHKDNYWRHYTLGRLSKESKNIYSFSVKEYKPETFKKNILSDITHIFKFLIDKNLSEVPLCYIKQKFKTIDIIGLVEILSKDQKYHDNIMLYLSVAQENKKTLGLINQKI